MKETLSIVIKLTGCQLLGGKIAENMGFSINVGEQAGVYTGVFLLGLREVINASILFYRASKQNNYKSIR